MRTIDRILRDSSTVAVVGLSPNPERESYRVAAYLQRQGYQVIPVNPNAEVVLGERCYPNLSAVRQRVDVVDIFRRSEDVPPIVDEAIQIKAEVVWMQLGIIHDEAAAKARQHGVEIVMDKCMLIEHEALISQGDSNKPLP